jgi:hypothetical protein
MFGISGEDDIVDPEPVSSSNNAGASHGGRTTFSGALVGHTVASGSNSDGGGGGDVGSPVVLGVNSSVGGLGSLPPAPVRRVNVGSPVVLSVNSSVVPLDNLPPAPVRRGGFNPPRTVANRYFPINKSCIVVMSAL